MSDYLTYAGTYTDGTSRGIYGWRFSSESGRLTPIGLVAETVNPSFLAVHPSQRFLYAVGEAPTGLLSAYSIDAGTGALQLLNQVASRGCGPCHVALDAAGTIAIAANYGSGSVAAWKIMADGRLGDAAAFLQKSGCGVNRLRQAGPHPHGAFFSPDNRFVVAPDLGLDTLCLYRLDPRLDSLEPADPPSVRLRPGAGPRHFAFHPAGRHGYVLNELDSTITAFAFEPAHGALREFSTVSTLPPGFAGDNIAAEIAVDRAGRFLYASNRGADNLAVYAIGRQGSLRLIEHVSTQGRTPRHFAIDPAGGWLLAANQDSDNLVVFRRDLATGRLTATGPPIEAAQPACVVFVEAGKATSPRRCRESSAPVAEE